MDFVGKKVTSLSNKALDGINELKSKTRASSRAQDADEEPSAPPGDGNVMIQSSMYDSRLTHNGSLPFGGDSMQSPPPPPIGFNLNQPTSSAPDRIQPLQQPTTTESSESLYQGDTWSLIWFQRIMLLSILKLMAFITKVYQDYQATKLYSVSGITGHLLISAASLLLPTIVFTIYRVSRYLQLSLPSLRASPAPYLTVESSQQQVAPLRGVPTSNDPASPVRGEDDGLVTARGTPTNADEFHDSKSEQQVPSVSPTSTALVNDSPATINIEPAYRERVKIHKLGNLPDRNSTRIAIGTSEQILHGVLYVFWHLKRQVDVIGYLVERACIWRKPKPEEVSEYGRLSIGSDGLEWFEDFYAGFLGILIQTYTICLYWTSNEALPVRANSLGSANKVLNQNIGNPTDFSSAARSASDLLHNQMLTGNVDKRDLLIMSQLLISIGVVGSLLMAVKRRDDGILTGVLSAIGWASLFAARIIIIAFAFVQIGWLIMLPLVLLHIAGITAWIYKIALDSHNGLKGESDESKWTDEELEAAGDKDAHQTMRLESSASNQPATIASRPTDLWSNFEHLVLLTQIATLFAVPSLFYWPIMFNLKLHSRPLKYLVLVLAENSALIITIWLLITATISAMQWYLLILVGVFSIVGFIFISLYVSCKPSLTEYFARADELFNEAERAGIYFELCSRVFKMPDLSKHAFRRLMNQTEVLEEINLDTN